MTRTVALMISIDTGVFKGRDSGSVTLIGGLSQNIGGFMCMPSLRLWSSPWWTIQDISQRYVAC